MFSMIVCVSIILQGLEATMYTVVPDKSASSCSDQTECSLMYYATHHDKFFREDHTTFQFLAGDHSLENSTLVYFVNISTLTLHGDTTNATQTRVMCNGEQSGGFSFYNITILMIKNLSFVRCSARALGFKGLIVLEIRQSHNLSMTNVHILETAGHGLSIDDLYGSSAISNVTIESSYSTARAGGGNFEYYCSDSHISRKDAAVTHHLNVSDSHFRNGNNYGYGTSGGVFIHTNCHTNIRIVFNHVVLTGNRAEMGGNFGIEYIETNPLWTVSIFILNSIFLNGSANAGGGLHMNAVVGSINNTDHGYTNDSCTILTVENTHFKYNNASYDGAAVYFRLHQNPFMQVGRIFFRNDCTFKHNRLIFPVNDSRSHGGVGIHIVTFTLPKYTQHNILFFVVKLSNCTLFDNRAKVVEDFGESRTGALYVENVQSLIIKDCSFIENNCTGVMAINSNLLLHGINSIRRNFAMRGGGMFFCSGSMMHLYNGTELVITQNRALLAGGGIFVDNECSPAVSNCFFQVDNITADNETLHKTKVYLLNNTAPSGSALYGGLIDNCNLFDKPGQKYTPLIPTKIFNAIFHIQHAKHDLSVISSDPLYVGFCKINSTTTKLSLKNCPLNTSVHVIPGKTFTQQAVVMGQHYGTVAGVVDVRCTSKNCCVPGEYYSQLIKLETKALELTYVVMPGDQKTVELELFAEDYYSGYPTYRYQPSYIHVTIEECPLGFREENHKCSCFLHGVICNITTQKLIRSNQHWIGYTEEYPKDTTDIIDHPFCPLGYCINKDVSINATRHHFDQDAQCDQYRTGLLCSHCKPGYSLGFGTSKCLPHCGSEHRYLVYFRVIGLIAVCAVAGVLLVVLLTLLNLTVAEGTLNGLIFHANIIQVNLDIFFPPETHARPWTAFIAWLNLDFGITVCFYDGMDAYAKTWLQFIFPLYIWLISGGIVYFSWKYNRVARLAGKNSVKVLATLFLLSFGKLIRTITAAVLYAYVSSSNGHISMHMWLHDASVRYLHGKHITLFVCALVMEVIALLYAFSLTFIQCLRRAPNNRMFGWVRRLKPLLDAYTGPYKDKYHFWTGLLLLVRITLFTAFAFNYNNDPRLNLTLIIIVTTVLMVAIQPGIYRQRLTGILESSMYVNLILFSTVMMFTINSHKAYKTIAVCVFGGWALLTFLGIIVYHTYKQAFGAVNCLELGRKWFGVHSRTEEVTVVQPLVIERGGSSDESKESEDEEDGLEMSYPS